MIDPKAQLAAVLLERGAEDPVDPLVAAWTGRLVELRGVGQERDCGELPVAVLGVSPRRGHLFSQFGLLSFALADVTGPHSARAGRLDFAVMVDGESAISVGLAIDMPVAIATQLSEMRRSPDDWALAGTGSQTSMTRRPPAKRRAEGSSA